MKAPLSFEFHGLVGFDLSTHDAKARRFFEAEYGRFLATTSAGGALVRLDWERGLPTGGEGLRAHTHKILARWAYRVVLGDDRVELVARGNHWAITMVHHMLVHPSLRYAASRSGTLLLHGAAVVRDGRSLILTGSGGAGKTTTAALLLEYGAAAWRPHADDYVFLRGDGITCAYPTRSHVYRNLLAWSPALGRRLKAGERLRLHLLWVLRRGSGERVRWPVRVEAARLWPGREIVDQARAAAIVVLRRAEASRPALRPIAPADFPVEELMRMNFEEARHFLRLVDLAGGARPANWRQMWEAREADVLRRAARQLPAYTLEIPRQPPSGRGSGSEVAEMLEGLMLRMGGF